MSIEARVSVTARFSSEEVAKSATSQLKKSLKTSQYELASALHNLNPIDNQDDYDGIEINVEQINRKKGVLSISSYTYKKEDPIWFAKSLYELGANRIFIRGQWDGYGRNYYFLDGVQVSKKKYDGDKPKKPLSKEDKEINKGLFLPEGRVAVKAQLTSSWSVGDIYESTGLAFKTVDGLVFYHQGKGQLVEALYDSGKGEFRIGDDIEFNAAFERGMLDGKYVSFAKRPTKIISGNTASHTSPIKTGGPITADDFKGKDRLFLKGVFGEFILNCFNRFRDNPNGLLMEVTNHKILNEPFAMLRRGIKKSSEGLVSFAGQSVEVDKAEKKLKIYSSPGADCTMKVKALTKHLTNSIENPLESNCGIGYTTMIWESEDARVALVILGAAFAIEIGNIDANERKRLIEISAKKEDKRNKLLSTLDISDLADFILEEGISHLDLALEKGFDLNSTDSAGQTLLHMIITVDAELAKTLIIKGIDCNILDDRKWSALHMFRRHNEPTPENKAFHRWFVAQGAIAKPSLYADEWR